MDNPAQLESQGTVQKSHSFVYLAGILAFQAYRAGEADATILDLIRQSEAQYANFKTELKEVNKCAPFCIP